jgi:hypothetical protein
VIRGCIRHWLPWALRPACGVVPLTDRAGPHSRSRSNDPRLLTL